MKRMLKKLWVICLAVVMIMAVYAGSVTEAAAERPKLSKTAVSIKAGNQMTLTVKNKISGAAYKWSTSNKKVAAVTQKGVVKGVKAGSAVITCEVKKAKKIYVLRCTVTVKKKADGRKPEETKEPETSEEAVNPSLSRTSMKVYACCEEQLTLRGAKALSWKSSAPRVASVDEKGNVFGHIMGSVVITCHADNGKDYLCDVEVVVDEENMSNWVDERFIHSSRFPGHIGYMYSRWMAWDCPDDPDGKFYWGLCDGKLSIFFMPSRPGTFRIDRYGKSGDIVKVDSITETYVDTNDLTDRNMYVHVLTEFGLENEADYLTYLANGCKVNIPTDKLPADNTEHRVID